MKKTFALFLLIICIFFFNYSDHAFSNSNQKDSFITLTSTDKSLRVNDSTNITVNINEHNNLKLTYMWSANIGKIGGQGKQVTYIAPDSKGKAVITVRITDEESNVYEDFISILIYKQFIILKADDLVFDKSYIISQNWKRFISYIKTKRIKSSIGIIGNSLKKRNSKYFSLIKNLNKSGYFEIWNHGYNHFLNDTKRDGKIYSEFSNTSYKFQKKYLLKTQNLAKKKLGITLHTFGAPGNAIDENTLQVIDEVDDIKVWLIGDISSTKLILSDHCWIERPIHNPNYQRFLNCYNPKLEYLLLQIHPHSWDEGRFEQLKKIIEYLIQEGVTFILPYEYYELLNMK